MRNYFEKKNDKENFESMDSTFYSHRESGFKNATILGIAFEVKDLKMSKIEEIEDLKKSKFEEVEV
jgi:hypothetical protein